VDGRDARAIEDALAGIDAPAFDLQLHGVGQFGNKQPHAMGGGARMTAGTSGAQGGSAIRRVGQPQDAHKFMPHVTLARLSHPDLDKLREWLIAHALATSDEFRVNAFCLYSSKLTSDGSIYRVEQEYPLKGYDDAEIDY
jgi:2'-5' RNA ligase